jgi:hypothetical protein
MNDRLKNKFPIQDGVSPVRSPSVFSIKKKILSVLQNIGLPALWFLASRLIVLAGFALMLLLLSEGFISPLSIYEHTPALSNVARGFQNRLPVEVSKRLEPLQFRWMGPEMRLRLETTVDGLLVFLRNPRPIPVELTVQQDGNILTHQSVSTGDSILSVDMNGASRSDIIFRPDSTFRPGGGDDRELSVQITRLVFRNGDIVEDLDKLAGTRIEGLFGHEYYYLGIAQIPLGDWLPQVSQNWDAVWYNVISEKGYSFDPDNRVKQTIAFFPLWPLLERYFRVTGLPSGWAELLLANALLFLTTIVWYWGVRTHFGSDGLAQSSLCLFLLWPGSLFTSLPFTEALFCLIVISVMVLLRYGKHEFLLALILALGTALRSAGIVLCAAVWLVKLLEWWRADDRSTRRMLSIGSLALLSVSGLLAFILYQGFRFGDFFAFSKSIQWDGILSSPTAVFSHKWLTALMDGFKLNGFAAFDSISFWDAAALVICVTGIFMLIKRHFWKEAVVAVFLVAYAYWPMKDHYLSSFTRYSCIVAPVFIGLASIRSTATKLLLGAVMAIGLFLLSFFYATGFFVA